jgi:hypothetical protein
LRYPSSSVTLLQSLSPKILSKALPRPSQRMRTPAAWRRPGKSLLGNGDPWSWLKIAGRACANACSSASRQNAVSKGIVRSPSEDVATEPVPDGDQIQASSLQAEGGKICPPDLIEAIDAPSTQQRRIAHLVPCWLAQPRAGRERHEAHLSQEPGHPLVVPLRAWSAQPGRHLLDPIKRRSGGLLVPQAPQQQVLLTFCYWLLIRARACQAHQLALSCQTEGWMLAFNQRPLLFHPPNGLFLTSPFPFSTAQSPDTKRPPGLHLFAHAAPVLQRS